MTRGRFCRDRLPDPTGYFRSIGITVIGRGEWRTAICPFHPDTRPSLRLRTDSGAFRCMACGARGGDLLAFHRLRTGLGFVAAARDLGAWELR
jgi:DNA primase